MRNLRHGYRKAKTISCTREKMISVRRTGTERQKPLPVPGKSWFLLVGRVQNDKNRFLYPEKARFCSSNGYRMAKTFFCTREKLIFARRTGTE